MPIKVACQCGQSFAAPDNLAGKVVKCPKCGSQLQIPRGQASAAPRPNTAGANRPAAPQRSAQPAGGLSSLLDEAGIVAHAGQRCMKCNTPLSPATSICLKCGYNSATGETIVSTVKNRSKGDGHGDVAESLLDKAASEIAKAPPPTTQTTSSVAMSYLLTAVLILIAGTVGYGAWAGFQAIESSGNSFYWAGVVMVVFGGLMFLVSGIALLVVGFKGGAQTGLMCALIPFYAYYYAIVNTQGFWVTLSILGVIFGISGWVMMTFLAESSTPMSMLFQLTVQHSLLS